MQTEEWGMYLENINEYSKVCFYFWRFNSQESDGVVVDENRASCVMPTFTQAEGWVDFEISIDGGPYYWKGMFFVGKYLDNRIFR